MVFQTLQHLTMAKERCSMFHGRQDILEKIASYLREGEPEPFTIYGPSGSGKTSIMAEAARKVPNYLIMTINTDKYKKEFK